MITTTSKSIPKFHVLAMDAGANELDFRNKTGTELSQIFLLKTALKTNRIERIFEHGEFAVRNSLSAIRFVERSILNCRRFGIEYWDQEKKKLQQ